MSGFSAELIDYLEGRITFEEFDRRRDERQAKESDVLSEDVEDDAQPSTSKQTPGIKEEGVSAGVQLAFASMLGGTTEPPSSEEEDEEDAGDTLSYVDDEDDEDYVVEKEQKAKVKLETAGRRRKAAGKGLKGKVKGRQWRDGEEEEEEEEEKMGGGGGGGGEDPSVGDVFALEMELNRENKKMMRVMKEWLN